MGEEVVSDEDTMAFMFAAYAAKGTEGMFVVSQGSWKYSGFEENSASKGLGK